MKTLEVRLGARLCRRGRAGFSLTADGKRVYEAAQHLFAALDTFRADIESVRSGGTVALKIGVSEGLVADPRCALPQAIRACEEQAKSFQIELSSGDPHELQTDLQNGHLNGAIIGLPSDLPLLKHKSIRHVVLYESPMQLCCGRAHPLFTVPDRQLRMEHVQQCQIVARSNWTRAFLRRLGIVSPRAIAQSFECVLALVLSGRYLGYLTENLMLSGIQLGDIRRIDLPPLRRKMSVYFASSNESEKSPALQRFRDYLIKSTRKAVAAHNI